MVHSDDNGLVLPPRIAPTQVAIIPIGAADEVNSLANSYKEMLEENDITCFSDLCQYSSINRSDWFDTLINSGAYFIKEYIKSRTWKIHHIVFSRSEV